jgi:hypothetical protein
MQQSKEMTAFCRDYISWFNNGTPSHEVFTTYNGLCRMWMDYILSTDTFVQGTLEVSYNELKEIFNSEKLDYMFPFNTSRSEYMDEMFVNKSHLNQQRIKWVTDHAMLETQND